MNGLGDIFLTSTVSDKLFCIGICQGLQQKDAQSVPGGSGQRVGCCVARCPQQLEIYIYY